ncbi:MAG: proline dehydrogenase family protein [Sphingobacteriaceae bacterium]|nr:proline dehydrogenase family protein [Sphingobacteriaceae bacterium]
MNPVTETKLNFDNTEIAFKHKNNAELNQAYWLFKIISSNFLTKIGPPITNFLLDIKMPIKPIIRATIFKQFCGGESIPQCDKVIEQLNKSGIGTILDYSVEGEEDEKVFDQTCEEILKTIHQAAIDKRIPLTVFKVTGIGRFALLEKMDAKQRLTDKDIAEFEKVKSRCEKICSTAFEKQVPIMIDAEETWIQNTIDALALEMMRKYNREKLIVYNTYQMYRHDKLESLKADHLIAQNEGFILGAKIVRGAYMEKERERAAEMNYPSPIQSTKENTDKDYNAALVYAVENINQMGIVCGTHNEKSSALLADLMQKKNINFNHPHIYFSQLLGMSDNLSYNLSNAKYNVVKYVPYGPIEAVLPYLFRRAQENTSVAGQTGRELGLILKEKLRRKG